MSKITWKMGLCRYSPDILRDFLNELGLEPNEFIVVPRPEQNWYYVLYYKPNKRYERKATK